MDYFKKYVLVLIACVGVFLALIFYLVNIPNSREANFIERSALTLLAPAMNPVKRTGSFFRNAWDEYFDLVNVRRENSQLLEKIKQLNSEINAGKEIQQANQRLSKLLDMKNSVKAPTVTASVIGEDVSSWFSTIVIDRGSSSGLKEGMAVVAAEGIVGQVVKVSQSSARVLLLTDHASGIAATIQRSRARGVVKGKGEGLCSLEFTTREEDVKVGDMVIASGIGGIFMKGLPIGEVTMVKRGEYGIFQTVTIRPAVNSARLEEVLVVMKGGYE
jgi:rod shape-determining protein MreC